MHDKNHDKDEILEKRYKLIKANKFRN
jgi:hypothetical protein